ncbi:MAG TPA: glycoside hydrolase family 28 protein [Opitutaceae bacterium]|nr:glycoside hydrolase family 28 protein [Opitutaceae bacterium]
MKSSLVFLICSLLGVMPSPAAPAAPTPRALLSTADGFRVGDAIAHGMNVVIRNGSIDLAADTPSDDRLVLLPLPAPERDLSAYRFVEAWITNRGNHPLEFTFWALSGHGWGGVSTFPVTGNEREMLPPGATRQYRIDLYARYPGANVYTPATNPGALRWLAIACEEHHAPIALSLGNVRAADSAPLARPDLSERISVPDVTHQSPAPGRRVYQQLPGWENTAIAHVLTLPRNWEPGRRFPVIVEYTGNRFFDKFCFSTGRTDQGHLAYGLSRGEDYICLNLPFVSPDGLREQIDGWGDIAKDVDYCVAAVKFVCARYGGDPQAVFFTGFSRGASASNYLALYNDRVAALWCGFVTEIDPGSPWAAARGSGWRHMDIGWNERAARMHGRPWYYQAPGFGRDVHVDVEFLEDRPSTIATRSWMRRVLARRPGPAAPVFSAMPRNLFVPPRTETDTSITLMWDKPEAPGDVADYVPYCDGRPLTATSRTNCTVDDLEPDRKHSFFIRARDASGRLSPPSDTITVRTLPLSPRLNVVNYGARGDGRSNDTLAIQRALDACPAGGTVEGPAGLFLSGALFLKSDLTLLIDAGGVLQGSKEPRDYEPLIRNRFEGWEMDTFASLLNAGRLDHAGPANVRNIAIRGKGEIRGGGTALARAMIAARGLRSRGRLICIMNCSGLNISGLTLDESPSWTVHYIYCDQVSCHGLTIRSEAANGDGMDPDSSSHCYIFDSSFATADDCIAIKSGKNPEGSRIARPAENIRVCDCDFLAGHGISIGSEISGGVNHVLIRDCRAGDLMLGLQIKGTKDRGGVVENVRVEDCVLRKIRVLTRLGYNNDGAAAPEPPVFRNFSFSNLDLRQADLAEPVIIVDGFDQDGHRTQNVRFENLQLPAGARIDIDESVGVAFINLRTTDGTKPRYQITRSQNISEGSPDGAPAGQIRPHA